MEATGYGSGMRILLLPRSAVTVLIMIVTVVLIIAILIALVRAAFRGLAALPALSVFLISLLLMIPGA